MKPRRSTSQGEYGLRRCDAQEILVRCIMAGTILTSTGDRDERIAPTPAIFIPLGVCGLSSVAGDTGWELG
jgi:hypothetical protein